MELAAKNKVENLISALLVSPKNRRIYEYYINGMPDKRVMLRQKMLQFCTDLCPAHAAEIRRCVFELIPFVIFPQEGEFGELKENAPPKLSMKNVLFPAVKTIKGTDAAKENEANVDRYAKNFSIWDNYNIHLNKKIGAAKSFR